MLGVTEKDLIWAQPAINGAMSTVVNTMSLSCIRNPSDTHAVANTHVLSFTPILFPAKRLIRASTRWIATIGTF